MQQEPRRSRRGLLAGSIAAVVALLGVVLVSPTEASWTQAQVGNSTDSAASGGLAFTHVGTATCSAGPAVASSTTCPGTVTPTSATSATAAVTGTDAITDNGTLPASRLSQKVQASSCAPVRYDNSKTATDPLLPRFATAFQQSDGWGTTTATSLSSGAYATDPIGVTGVSVLGSNWTIGIRFKVANGYTGGGGLISLAPSPSNATTGSGPLELWMDNTGKLRYQVVGTLGLGTTSGVSSAAYNDGRWHTAVLTMGSVLISGVFLYVDGVQATSSLGLSALTGVAAYWHLGWADAGSLTGAPSSAAITGSLSGAFVTAAASSLTNLTAVNNAASASAYSTAVLALSNVGNLWMLGDPGTTTYAGTLPATMATPCAQVDVAFGFTSPTASIAQQSLAAFVAGGGGTVAAPGPGVTQTMTVSLTRDATWNGDVAGLHLYAPLTVTETTAPASTWSLAFTWPSAAGAFLA
ncbi:MAG: hypothetical protein QM747_19835 [Nocardioides sp.]